MLGSRAIYFLVFSLVRSVAGQFTFDPILMDDSFEIVTGVGMCHDSNGNIFDYGQFSGEGVVTKESCVALCGEYDFATLAGLSINSGICTCYYEDGTTPASLPTKNEEGNGVAPITQTDGTTTGETCYKYNEPENQLTEPDCVLGENGIAICTYQFGLNDLSLLKLQVREPNDEGGCSTLPMDSSKVKTTGSTDSNGNFVIQVEGIPDTIGYDEAFVYCTVAYIEDQTGDVVASVEMATELTFETEDSVVNVVDVTGNIAPTINVGSRIYGVTATRIGANGGPVSTRLELGDNLFFKISSDTTGVTISGVNTFRADKGPISMVLSEVASNFFVFGRNSENIIVSTRLPARFFTDDNPITISGEVSLVINGRRYLQRILQTFATPVAEYEFEVEVVPDPRATGLDPAQSSTKSTRRASRLLVTLGTLLGILAFWP